jgi:membrane-associated phospholipid phosphatase
MTISPRLAPFLAALFAAATPLTGAAVLPAQELNAAPLPSLTVRRERGWPDTTKTFFTSRDVAYTGAALAGTVLVSFFDKQIARWTQQPSVQGGSSRHDVVSKLTKVNETTLTGAALLTYGVGRLAHSRTTADVALHTAESTILTSVISQIIRGPLGRARPSVSPDDQYKFQFGKGFTRFDNRAFPSLHTATAFAAASALVAEIRVRSPDAVWYAAPLLYSGAAVPGLTRMYLNQHWASDIVSGAFVGTLLGSRVVHYAHTHRRTRLDRALLGATSAVPDGSGGFLLMVTIRR